MPNDILRRIVTGEETCLYQFDPEEKFYPSHYILLEKPKINIEVLERISRSSASFCVKKSLLADLTEGDQRLGSETQLIQLKQFSLKMLPKFLLLWCQNCCAQIGNKYQRSFQWKFCTNGTNTRHAYKMAT